MAADIAENETYEPFVRPLQDREMVVGGDKQYLTFTSKLGYTATVERCAGEEGIWLLTVDDLFEI